MTAEEEEIYSNFKSLRQYKPRHYAKQVAARMKDGLYELQRIYNVASGRYFCSEILPILIDVFNEEKLRREAIKQKIKKMNENA